jgi:hypothetical protein
MFKSDIITVCFYLCGLLEIAFRLTVRRVCEYITNTIISLIFRNIRHMDLHQSHNSKLISWLDIWIVLQMLLMDYETQNFRHLQHTQFYISLHLCKASKILKHYVSLFEMKSFPTCYMNCIFFLL